MATRTAVAGDLDALVALADETVSSGWRCDPDVVRPTREQLEGWLAGAHGTEITVFSATANGPITAALVHRGAHVKWMLDPRDLGFLVRLVALSQAVFDAYGDCWGRIRDVNSRGLVRREDARFILDPATDIVRYVP